MSAPYPLILACIDGSDADGPVLAEATALAGLDPSTRLVLVHVVAVPLELGDTTDPSMIGVTVPLDPEPFLEFGRQRLAHALESAPGAETLLLEDEHPAAGVCDWAAEEGADLIVAGSHRGRFDRILLGSFAGHVAHHAPCAVLLARVPHGDRHRHHRRERSA